MTAASAGALSALRLGTPTIWRVIGSIRDRSAREGIPAVAERKGEPMEHTLTRHAEILTVTAREAVEELDAVREHPEVIDALRDLAACVSKLADDLEPFRHELMDDEPELVERLIVVSGAVQSVIAEES